ncbi:MAG: ribosome-recycling factor, partial [Gemmatimonadetes bacterium]|nr:ribosome-recycling factor [Gemmatimonadota bacterium]
MPTIKNAKEKMESTFGALKRDFTTVRTGKATPALLD